MTKMELYYYDMSIVYLLRLGTCYNRSMLELELVFVRDIIKGGKGTPDLNARDAWIP